MKCVRYWSKVSVFAIPCEDKWSLDQEYEHRTFLLDVDRFKIESGELRCPARNRLGFMCIRFRRHDHVTYCCQSGKSGTIWESNRVSGVRKACFA